MGFIIEPTVTEKMTRLTDKSSEDKVVKHKGEKRTILVQPKYGFTVKPEANEFEIKKEVETSYNVIVVDMNTTCYAGRRQARYAKAGPVRGQKNAFKKATVTLKSGDPVDSYGDI